MADLTTRLAQFLNTLASGTMIGFFGSGQTQGVVSGVLTVNTATTGTGADTTEDVLWTYSLPANTLSADGKSVRITVMWQAGATANNKTTKVYFGSTAYTARSAAADNGTMFRLVMEVLRTGASAQVMAAMFTASGGLVGSTVVTPAEDMTAAIVIKFTGQNGTAVANDVVFKGAIVEALN